MSTTHARRDEVDGVLTVTFSRDEKLNAISPEMFGLLSEAATDLAERDDLRVMVITAEGRYFTGGYDITTIKPDIGRGADGRTYGSNLRRHYRVYAHHDLFDRFESIEKPIVLGVQAPCYGIGLEMGLSCDFRLAADNATFSLPEIPQLAVIPGSGGISRLTRIVGPHWAKWIAMAGETISADDARIMGLVHAVYPASEFSDRLQAFAHRLAGLSREALGVAKVAIDIAAEVDRRTARDFDRFAQTALITGEEYQLRIAEEQQRRSAART